MYTPKISIIIPVYNTQDYLKECFDSIVNQTYQNWELFIVDDGSTDNSPEICDYYCSLDERIKVIHKINEGQGVARNVALDITSGEYIMFIDSDDYVLVDMLEVLVNHLQDKKYDLLIFEAKLIHKHSEDKIIEYNDTFELDNYGLMEFYVKKRITTGPVTKLFNIEVFKNIRFPAFRACEDSYVLHHLLGRCNNALILPYAFYMQNFRLGSTEQQPFNLSRMHKLDARNNFRDYISKNYPSLLNLVVERPAEIALNLIFQIVMYGFMGKYKKEYNYLLETCKKERQLLINYNCADRKLMKDLELIEKAYFLFVAKQYYSAFTYRSIEFASRLKRSLKSKCCSMFKRAEIKGS